MASALQTIADYVAEARVLLQDTVVTYRYSDAELLSGLNLALQSARRLRPDLFISLLGVPPYYAAVAATDVALDAQYRHAVLLFMVGHAQIRDEEETMDARAAALLGAFRAQLVDTVAYTGRVR